MRIESAGNGASATATASAPPATTHRGGALHLRVLGAFDCEGIEDVASRKARRLLKVLALARGKPVPGERLALCLWDDEPSHVVRQLSVLVSRLRSVVGAARIVRSDSGYSLVADWLDLSAALQYAQTAAERLVEYRYAEARTLATDGLSLFRGPLLAEEADAEWVASHRVAAARLAAHLRLLAADAALAMGDVAAAAHMAEVQMEDDPLDERGLRMFMVARALAGRPAQALAMYGRFRSQLIDAAVTAPSPQTEALRAAIANGEQLPGKPAMISSTADSGGVDDADGNDGIVALGEAATTLRAAAVLGREVDLGVLAKTLGLPYAAVLRHVETGVRRGLLADEGISLVFLDKGVRETLAASFPAPCRVFLRSTATRVR